eukprot:TRINITY_DN5582_c0_g1_i1.p1 TRINITY_DN5582_c0_g1~~TRINITY_DN5582_c0_g1_i1.p1  ORF type:complete len:308 (-),score=37.95 TRINITY_DN5582_c0_g1_i1:649-1467(-)
MLALSKYQAYSGQVNTRQLSLQPTHALQPLTPKTFSTQNSLPKQGITKSRNFTRTYAINFGTIGKEIASGLSRQNHVRLIMMRHGESEVGRGADHLRPITEDGKQSSQRVAQQLAALGWIPQTILASDALRTRQTVEAMRALASVIREVKVQFLGSLYAVSALDGMTRQHLSECILKEVATMKLAVNCVMCVGHNKGWEEATSSFCGQEIKLGTSSAALLESSASNWEDALKEDSKWKLVRLLESTENGQQESEVEKDGSWWQKLLPQFSRV